MIQSPLPGIPNVDYRITQWFGERPEVYKQFGLKGHNGIDFAPKVAGTKGVVIYAPHDGICYLRDDGGKGYGKYVELDDDFRSRRSILAHLDKYLVRNLQDVRMGDPIGIMGTTGFSTGIHLHWGYKPLVKGKTKPLEFTNGYKGAVDIVKFVTIPNIGVDTPFLNLRNFQFSTR